ncbi:MAG: hypothetical protein CVU87_11365 [Firmicutes bacterium HGW-Firmicutes-12]|nr:MAG: hypothetical protein CVU87_11365 [Firmicutes bacterium HGW-Firmicutes-12]
MNKNTPWYAKALIAAIISYALSPIDLIPDFVPILGYLDEANSPRSYGGMPY